MRHFALMHNVTDKCADGKTPYEKRFDNKFTGFGIEIEYKPSSPVVLNQMHPLGDKLLPGIFIGYKQKCGGSYDGTVFIADWEDFGNAEKAGEIHVRCIAEENVFPKLYHNKRRMLPREAK